MVTEVHVVGLGPLGEGDPLVDGVQQFVLDLSHCVTVQHLDRHLRPGLAFRRDAHQRLREREVWEIDPVVRERYCRKQEFYNLTSQL